jgi:PST family polysaccharide transporter
MIAWLRINSRVKNRPILKKIIKNVGWLSFDKLLQLVVSLVVGIWIARYLGPNDFGILSFAIAFGALISPFIGLGFGGLIERELIKNLIH